MEITKDSLLNFFKEPTIEEFAHFLQQNVGESNNVDFKENWIDFDKMAKIILGIANSGGGAIVIGVSEQDNNIVAAGIPNDNIIDAADLIKKISKYFPEKILSCINLLNFFYDNEVYGTLRGKKFQVIIIRVKPSDLPVICESDSKSLQKADIYIRRGTSTEKINYDELQELIAVKIEAEKDRISNLELKDELVQLRTLYDAVPVTVKKMGISGITQSSMFLSVMGLQQNAIYPKEGYEDFLVSSIEKKKEKIKRML
ncbi:helix-turn-helix domain-containing protein [Pelosinus sp. sgz500959]|uniref:AlbA family DNA-binding domain-containing protein n=1 Tax=Pelosinus sp. sgz500959 TaxID=3242472 RepID=UPI00366EC658